MISKELDLMNRWENCLSMRDCFVTSQPRNVRVLRVVCGISAGMQDTSFRGVFKNKNKLSKKMESFSLRTACVLLLYINFFHLCKNVFSMDQCEICGQKKRFSITFYNINIYHQYVEPCFGVITEGEGEICSNCVRATNHYKKSGKTFHHVSKTE